MIFFLFFTALSFARGGDGEGPRYAPRCNEQALNQCIANARSLYNRSHDELQELSAGKDIFERQRAPFAAQKLTMEAFSRETQSNLEFLAAEIEYLKRKQSGSNQFSHIRAIVLSEKTNDTRWWESDYSQRKNRLVNLQQQLENLADSNHYHLEETMNKLNELDGSLSKQNALISSQQSLVSKYQRMMQMGCREQVCPSNP